MNKARGCDHRKWLFAPLTMWTLGAAAAGFDHRYSIHQGDLNGDGKIDLFVKWSPQIVVIPLDDLSIPIPGFPGLSTCSTQGPFDSGGPYFNYAITANQRALSQAEQRRPFWVSRYEVNCDPFAPSALGVVDERGLGLVTMKWLRAIAAEKNLTLDEQALGVDIMRAHVDTTDIDTQGIIHLLSKSQITDYHVDVFESYGLPDYTFGGAPFGTSSRSGAFWEWFLGEWMWCPDCDRVP